MQNEFTRKRGHKEMIPIISNTGIENDYMYEDDYDIRVIHGFENVLKYANPKTRKEIGLVIEVKKSKS